MFKNMKILEITENFKECEKKFIFINEQFFTKNQLV